MTNGFNDAELSISDATLIARLRERAVQERIIQKNNEAVAVALMGQRLLFDQGIHSASNSFAVSLGLEYENCAKNDAKLANDWDAAADRIEELKHRLFQCATDLQIYMDAFAVSEAKLATCEKYRDAYAEMDRIVTQAVRDLEAKLAKAVERLTNLEKSASEVSRYGAATGPQWTKMSIDILAARATIAEIKLQSSEFATQKGDTP